ncbi:hypothetical protein PF005_g31404 [Phytophthora fragariae]|uniref:Secreted protein n=2 Tax=Phytophthora TaxID=4783 RepID=A0A6A3DH16_9STRA|nr:hypothetical protein PF009_g31492 [Phytophthora fragariae]KAE8970052.1 hypothetical protein PR002_g27239 [Phytophthora rubi]KAE8970543.1 hypothetical protein PR001_g27175 [Phytophthora rubi]KAE9006111.1 hypothetical protein PF011_g11741 [Phytophthora fragariae]KAE9057144.1 hypothetical protein PF010_g31493 [Phytophthora fragariae]
MWLSLLIALLVDTLPFRPENCTVWSRLFPCLWTHQWSSRNSLVDSCYYFLLNGGSNVDMSAPDIKSRGRPSRRRCHSWPTSALPTRPTSAAAPRSRALPVRPD